MSIGLIISGIGIAGVVSAGVFSMLSANTKVQQATQTQALLDQAAYSLVTETSESGGLLGLYATGFTAGMDKALIPSSSTAPKRDGFGKNLVVCTPSSFPVPSATSSAVFAILSPGPDGVFHTNSTCANALTGVKGGDDGLRFKTVMDVRKGVGGTVYFGDPVDTAANLPTGMKDGEVRFVKDEQKIYQYKSGTGWGKTLADAAAVPPAAFSSSLQTQTLNDACSVVGALAKDSNGKLMVCGTDDLIINGDCSTFESGTITYNSRGYQYVCN